MVSRSIAVLSAALLVACEHSEPFTPAAPDPAGPFSDRLPRQLTFNPSDDVSPYGHGQSVIYARRDPARTEPGSCLAVLPALGGTLQSEYCPPGPTPADTFLSTWLEPALSRDGRRVAFLWQRGARGAIGAWSHHVVVAPADAPRDTTFGLLLSDTLADGRRFNTLIEPRWTSAGRIRFLVAYDSVERLVGGGIGDTIAVPRGLVEVDPAAGTLTAVSGGDSVSAYTIAPDGTVWLVRPNDPTLLMRIDPGTGLAVAVDRWAAPSTDLAWTDGKVAAAIPSLNRIEWIDAASGTRGGLSTPGTVRRIAGVEGGRIVGELVLAAGGPPDLWLFEVR